MTLLLEPLAGLMVIGFSLFSIALSTELAKRRYSRYMWAWIGTKLAALLLAVWMYSWLGLLGVLLGYIIPPTHLRRILPKISTQERSKYGGDKKENELRFKSV